MADVGGVNSPVRIWCLSAIRRSDDFLFAGLAHLEERDESDCLRLSDVNCNKLVYTSAQVFKCRAVHFIICAHTPPHLNLTSTPSPHIYMANTYVLLYLYVYNNIIMFRNVFLIYTC